MVSTGHVQPPIKPECSTACAGKVCTMISSPAENSQYPSRPQPVCQTQVCTACLPACSYIFSTCLTPHGPHLWSPAALRLYRWVKRGSRHCVFWSVLPCCPPICLNRAFTVLWPTGHTRSQTRRRCVITTRSPVWNLSVQHAPEPQ
jgi:hypothetical protein